MMYRNSFSVLTIIFMMSCSMCAVMKFYDKETGQCIIINIEEAILDKFYKCMVKTKTGNCILFLKMLSLTNWTAHGVSREDGSPETLNSYLCTLKEKQCCDNTDFYGCGYDKVECKRFCCCEPICQTAEFVIWWLYYGENLFHHYMTPCPDNNNCSYYSKVKSTTETMSKSSNTQTSTSTQVWTFYTSLTNTSTGYSLNHVTAYNDSLTEGSPGVNVVIITIGTIVSVLAVTIVCVLVLCLWRRRNRSKDVSNNSNTPVGDNYVNFCNSQQKHLAASETVIKTETSLDPGLNEYCTSMHFELKAFEINDNNKVRDAYINVYNNIHEISQYNEKDETNQYNETYETIQNNKTQETSQYNNILLNQSNNQDYKNTDKAKSDVLVSLYSRLGEQVRSFQEDYSCLPASEI